MKFKLGSLYQITAFFATEPLLAVVSLPQFAFAHFGAGVKSSLVFLRRKAENEQLGNYPIFMAIADHIGYDATGKLDKHNDLPEIADIYRNLGGNILDNSMVFQVWSHEIEGRIDSFYYKPTFRQLTNKLRNANAVPFKEVIKSITNGLDYRNFNVEGQIYYLRVSNIKPDEIEYKNAMRVTLALSEVTKNIHGHKGDILLTRKGTFGISAVLDNDLEGIISSEIFLLKIDQRKINPEYLSIYLNSVYGQKQFSSKKVGAIMGSLSQEAVGEILILIPPMDTQNKIVTEYKNKLIKARQLEKEAKTLREFAKKQVENLILPD